MKKYWQKIKSKIEYTAPVTTTFLFISFIVTMANYATVGSVNAFFSSPTGINIFNPIFYFNLVSHIFAHANWSHFIGNFLMIGVLGNLLERTYGKSRLIILIVSTAVISAISNALLFAGPMIGASGIVFMMLMLGTFSESKTNGKVPLLFVFVFLAYTTGEIVNAITDKQNISQFAHIIGGICGAGFGYFLNKRTK